MKVLNINPVLFKSQKTVTEPTKKDIQYNQLNELGSVVPDYSVRTPQNYTSLGVENLSNGLKLYSYKLANGHRVSIVPMEGSPAVVKNYVNVGSMNETDDIKGISHFLEHMAFNGTNGGNGYIKLKQGESFSKIEELGGWSNASTNYSVTDYVNSTPLLEDKDLEEQIKVIAAMTENLSLTSEMIEKEKGPVCSEIDMILDSPQTLLMDKSVRSLFNIKSSADELVGGSVRHIQNLTRKDVKDYYDKYYTPDNMNLVITGDVDPQKSIELVAKNFHSHKKGNAKSYYSEKLTPITQTVRNDYITNKATSAEMMLAFAGPKLNDTKSKIISEIMEKYIFNTNFGLKKELRDLNAKAMFGVEEISHQKNAPSMIYFVGNSSEENSEKVLKLFWDKLSKINAPTEKELNIIKHSLKQNFQLNFQYSNPVNSFIGNSILVDDLDYILKYEQILDSITREDIELFIKEYLNMNKVAVTVVHPQTDIELINKNHLEATKISFKGKRKPINFDNVSTKTLSNNYEVVFMETTNDNVYCSLNLDCQMSKNDFSPATISVLNRIYNMGTSLRTQEELDLIKEESNIGLNSSVSLGRLRIQTFSDKENFEKTFGLMKELLNNPRISKKEFERAKSDIKDSLKRANDTSESLYLENESKENPYYISRNDIKKDLDNITLEDVQKLHDYILTNSKGFFVVNIPKSNLDLRNEFEQKFSELKTVQPMKYELEKSYRPNREVQILMKDRDVSQADIMQVHKFECVGSAKERVLFAIINAMLTNSSIGLFNTLREKEHLAYSVYSDCELEGNCGELSCNILTTTDNKERGETSYENVQKSINGFNRQINELRASKYTDKDLENAKRMIKATLLEKEGVPLKLNALADGIKNGNGIEFENIMFEEIDNISRKDIDEFVSRIFKNPPIYSIVASKDTLEFNKEYFEQLKNYNLSQTTP